MTEYTFDFRRITWGDLERARSGTLEDMLLLYDRVVVGGVLHLSVNEIGYNVVPQFKRAFDTWLERGQAKDVMPKPQVYDTPPDEDGLRDLLNGIEGL